MPSENPQLKINLLAFSALPKGNLYIRTFTVIFDILIAGNISKDIIISDREQREAPGGSIYYGAFAVAFVSRQAKINFLTITKLSINDFELLNDFWKHCIPVLTIPARTTTVMKDSFLRKNNYKRESKIISLAPNFKFKEIASIKAKIYYLAGLLYGEFSKDLISHLYRKITDNKFTAGTESKAGIAIDAQCLIRRLQDKRIVLKDWESKKSHLGYVKYLKVDTDEAFILTGEKKPENMIKALLSLGVREIVLTSDEGAYLGMQDHISFLPFDPYSYKNRQGRGDTCFASYLSYRCRYEPEDSFRYAVKVTNNKLSKEGPLL